MSWVPSDCSLTGPCSLIRWPATVQLPSNVLPCNRSQPCRSCSLQPMLIHKICSLQDYMAPPHEPTCLSAEISQRYPVKESRPEAPPKHDGPTDDPEKDFCPGSSAQSPRDDLIAYVHNVAQCAIDQEPLFKLNKPNDGACHRCSAVCTLICPCRAGTAPPLPCARAPANVSATVCLTAVYLWQASFTSMFWICTSATTQMRQTSPRSRVSWTPVMSTTHMVRRPR